MEKYVIACDFYKKVVKVNMVGDSTLTMGSDYQDKPCMTVYLRDHSNMSVPRLNVKEVAETFTSKQEAEKIAEELSKTPFDEGKIVCHVETL
jgi:hypothetical protein